MIIGIDASRAFLKNRTGIEEYSYQVIKHLRDTLPGTEKVILYVRRKIVWQYGKLSLSYPEMSFSLPQNWEVRGIWAPRFWTQVGLSLEMLRHSPEVLFVPAHTVPFIHPRRTVVTIHGLEYEFCKAAYSFWERLYMRYSIKFSCAVASKVICVSQNTKQDVMNVYQVPERKIAVIYEGYTDERAQIVTHTSLEAPYLLFTGRLEERKNIVRLIEAFAILKEKYSIPHTLVLLGKFGYGQAKIEESIQASKYKEAIVLLGYVSEKEKWRWLTQADVFLFPTLYEGFGLPILEAQSVGVPIVTSTTSSLPEIAGGGALLVDPLNPAAIAQSVYRLLSDVQLRSDIIEKATQNVSRFSWRQCAQEVTALLCAPR